MLTQDVSDIALKQVYALSKKTGIPGHYIIEVWNSETGFHPTNSNFGGIQYFGPAAVMASSVPVPPSMFQSYTLEQRIPNFEPLLRSQMATNGGQVPDRPEVLYSINFVPARMRAAGPNPPGSTIIIDRGGQFWDDNPVFHPYADPAGISVNSMGRVLAQKRATDFRLAELLSRYTALTGEKYPTPGNLKKWYQRGTVVFAGIGLLAAGTYYAYSKVK